MRDTQIHEARRAFAESIAQAERRDAVFGGLADNVLIPYVLLGWSGLILEANAAARRLLLSRAPGFDAAIEEIQHDSEQPFSVRPLGDFISPDSKRVFWEHLRDCRKSTQHRRTYLTLKINGHELPVQLITQPWIRTPDQTVRFRTVILDASPELHCQQRFQQNARNLQRMFDISNTVMWEADYKTGNILFVGQGIERMLGHPLPRPGERVRFWEHHIQAEDQQRVLEAFGALKRYEKAVTLEYRMVRADRTVIWVRNTLEAQEQAGELIIRGLLTDITRNKLLEEQNANIQSQLEAKIDQRTTELQRTVAELEAFSYSLSHDMRAPLRAMYGFSELLTREYGHKLDNLGRDFLQRIQASARRLDRLICDVLSYNRVLRAPLEFSKVEMDTLIDHIIYERPEFQRPHARIEIQKPLLPVLGHEAFLYQCLFNLIDNAVKFVPRNVTPRVRIWTEARGDDVRLWIEDNGIGIEPKHRQRLFTLFTRLHPEAMYEGTGIGLVIVRKAVERMRGDIGLESAPVTGTKFWIQLRRAE